MKVKRLFSFILISFFFLCTFPSETRVYSQDHASTKERWEKMTPQEKQKMKENYKRWKTLPPEKRQRIKEKSEKFKKLPPEEQERIRKKVNKLKGRKKNN